MSSKNKEKPVEIVVIELLIKTLELRDVYTQGHSRRVGLYAQELVNMCGFARKQVQEITMAGILHDIGKIAIPDGVLLKNGALDEDESQVIKLHSQLGYNLLHKMAFFDNIAEFVRDHHECLDGSGYPAGKTASEIAMPSRIVAVADIFDALTSKRIYRLKPFTLEETHSIIDAEAKKGKLDTNLAKMVKHLKIIEHEWDAVDPLLGICEGYRRKAK